MSALPQRMIFVYTQMMELTFDPIKRAKALAERRLDFLDAKEVFAGLVFQQQDIRFDYGEVRIITVGRLRGRMVVLVWTERAGARHIISMRKANSREQARYETALE